jgi:hypothetical protein
MPAAIADAQRRVGFREHQMPTERRIHRRHQQAVIATGQRAGDGSRRIAAEAVGEPPFAALRLHEVAADLSTKADESWKFCFHA